ncbi:MAG: peptidylprolyl isomerase, partial [Deltaproteobacteria bacterium]
CVYLALTALGLTLGACSAPSSNDVSVTDASNDTAPGDAIADGVPADAPVASACTLPAGYTLTPFLSDTATWDFTAADMVLVPARDYVAVIETDVGRITLDLFEDQTPITINSFVFLARNHYFDGQAFHRVLEGFVAQGGDPNTLSTTRSSWGTGGPGYMFGLEIVASQHYDAAGVLGMARATSPDSNGSQFFITLAPTPSLDGMYTIFGRVLTGLEVLPLLARNATQTSPPAAPSRMRHVCIAERAR